MKNETTNPKSTISRIKPPLVLAVCLILTALGPPAADRASGQGRGGPPNPVNFTVILPNCGVYVQGTTTGREGVIFLPSGGLIVTGPDLYTTLTNLSDPTKSVTLNICGSAHVSFDQNGDAILMLTGRSVFSDPAFGPEILLLVGDFTIVYDSNGNLISGPTGNGQITNVCDLIT